MQALVETCCARRGWKPADIPLRAPVAVDELFTQFSEAQYSVGGVNITLTLRPSAGCRRRRSSAQRQNALDNAIDFTPENGVITH